MKIIHWLVAHPNPSGADKFAFSMFKGGLTIGQERYVAFSNVEASNNFVWQGKLYRSLSHKDAIEMKNAVNIFHQHMPICFNKLTNKVFFAHGSPAYALERFESISVSATFIKQTDIVLTAWPSHMQYWRALGGKPVFYNQPGVDLTWFTEHGPKIEIQHHPYLLWCDTWKSIKEPWNLLFGLKLAAKELPHITVKFVNIPTVYSDSPAQFAEANRSKREMLNYLIGSLSLDSIVEFPILDMVSDIRPFYRGADFVYSPAGPEGNNVSWEAEACGKNVICDNQPDQIAATLIRMSAGPCFKATPKDILETVKQQEDIFKGEFNLE